LPKGRTPSIHSRFFYRELTMEDKIILHTAGKGNMTLGFKHIIECYQVLWNRGYRPHKDLNKYLDKQIIPEHTET
jgi:hypothetical protein